MSSSREAWQRLYSKHGLQYGGIGDILPLEPFLHPGMIALDAGCGDGKTTELIARRCDVVGLDFSREALMSLRAQRPSLTYADLVECELPYLPFESEKFDAIACVHAISHMLRKERTRVAEELMRVLKAGGHMLVEGFGRNDLRYGEGSEVEECSFLRGNGILTHYFDPREMPRLFRGLETLSETSSSKRISFGARSGKREIIRVVLRKKSQ
jgi:cyclopropane fatty-acyl-phospholipid synthase-like methyltransferase